MAEATVETEKTSKRTTLKHAVDYIAVCMSKSMSNGDLAELRRVNHQSPYSAALWRLMMALEDKHEEVYRQTEQETDEQEAVTRWGVLLMGMAHNVGLHGGVPLGQALAQAGWSELRFERLMRARDVSLLALIGPMSKFLASKAQPANWDQVAGLLFYQEGERARQERHKIARAYFGALYRAQS